jgi:uncharacterized protein YlxW (UPF0749 family)
MPDPAEISSNLGIVGTIGAGVTFALGWGVTLVLKKLGLTASTASDANAQAQKDMLDWQREQLRDEVSRREKAEAQVQSLLEKQNEFTLSMARMESLNKTLQDQVQTLSDNVAKLEARLAGAN